jgi:cystathionine beta-lyase/cystathionine gamma-synthase
MDAAAEVIARLEGAKGALLFASGCAAISTSLLSFAKAGDHIVSIPSFVPTCTCKCIVSILSWLDKPLIASCAALYICVNSL